MNDIFKTLKNHRSIREYKDENLSPEHRERLLEVIDYIPTSIHGQGISVIVVENKEKREKLIQLTQNQAYVGTCSMFVVIAMDFYRASLAAKINNKELEITNSIESVLVGSVDSGILLGNLVMAAESLGLGTVPIGAVRNAPKEIIELLHLPKYTFPVVGLCIGIPSHKPDGVKPRMPKKNTVFIDEYQSEDMLKDIEKYDQDLEHFNKTHRNWDSNWSSFVSNFYDKVYYPHVFSTLKEQGFKLDS